MIFLVHSRFQVTPQNSLSVSFLKDHSKRVIMNGINHIKVTIDVITG